MVSFGWFEEVGVLLMWTRRFSGDESFIDAASTDKSIDAGELGVVIEGKKKVDGTPLSPSRL